MNYPSEKTIAREHAREYTAPRATAHFYTSHDSQDTAESTHDPPHNHKRNIIKSRRSIRICSEFVIRLIAYWRAPARRRARFYELFRFAFF